MTKPIPININEALRYDPKTGKIFRFKGTYRGITGNKNKRGYLTLEFENERYFAHRVAWFFLYGNPVPDVIDHINGDKADNRAINLRAATQALNVANRRKNASTKNRFKGVIAVPYKSCIKYKARVVQGRKVHHLGYFDTIEEAAAAYDKKAILLFGAFANLNLSGS